MLKKGPLSPFSCTYSANFPELLLQLNCSLAISTYQAGKIVFISAKDEHHLVQLPRTFNRAMGMAIHEDQLAIAVKDEVVLLTNAPELARTYPKNPGIYDALFVPQVIYNTGQVDLHDLHWGQNHKLWGVNTSFSCLVTMSDRFSWQPEWKPHFIDKLVSEDRCHLNGLAMRNDAPAFVTALGGQNTIQGWRQTLPQGGILMDVIKNEIILDGLAMPHSPRLYDDALYILLSATGQLIKVDVINKSYKVLKEIDGFTRGMAKIGDYLFIGISKLRPNSSNFRDLEIARKAMHAGVKILHLPTCSLVAELNYQTSVDEIYDVQVLPDILRPGILNTMTPMYKYGLSIPGATYWAKELPEEK